MHGFELIVTLTGCLGAALLAGYVTQRLGLSPIVGYLLGGTIVGPYTPGFVADLAVAEQLAEIGVILLMFGVGLQFHIEALLAVRRVAIPGAILQSATATALGVALALSIGWTLAAGIVFGIALSVASTVVLIRVLTDHRDLHTQTGHIAVGWLVVEDLFTVIALVLLPVIFAEGATTGRELAIALGLTAIKVAVLAALIMLAGNRLIPKLLDHVAMTRSRELFTLTVLVLALGIAVSSATFFGVSMALGAFLAGLAVGRSDYSSRAASEALPMRDAFAVLFFVSVGMLLDPGQMLANPYLLAGTLAIILIGKPVAALVIVRVLGYPFRVALAVAVALAQIGEFSFMLSSVGRDLGILDVAASQTLVAASILSIVLNPLLYRAVDPIERWTAARPAWRRLLNPRDTPTDDPSLAARRDTDPRHRAVVVGYGPSGQTITRLLRENGIEPAVVELNMETVKRLRTEGTHAVYGDASHQETLEEAGLASAASLVLTTADLSNAEEVIRVAGEVNPNARVLARTTYLRDARRLKQAGAEHVFSGEGEAALALTEAILQRLGATAEQIDRERERVHASLTA